MSICHSCGQDTADETLLESMQQTIDDARAERDEALGQVDKLREILKVLVSSVRDEADEAEHQAGRV